MMKKNALLVRQQFGAILDSMDQGGDPIIIEKNNMPVAALIPYELFREKFIEFQNQKDRDELFERFKKAMKPAKDSTVKSLRQLRYGE